MNDPEPSLPPPEPGSSFLTNAQIADLDEKAKIATSLRETDLRSIAPPELRESLLKLLSGYEILGVPRTTHQLWHRARVCPSPEGFASLHELIYPQKGNASYGRANLPGSSVMYASWNHPTCIDEIHAEEGNYVHSITFRPVAGSFIPCHIVGNYQAFNSSGRCLIDSPALQSALTAMQAQRPAEFMTAVFVDSFLSEFFGRINAVSYDYKLSAVYSELLLTNGGIIFPSVRNRGGMNLAIPSKLFDSTCEVVTTQVSKLHRALGYGLYFEHPQRRSCDFSDDGTIIWSSKSRGVRWSPGGGLEFDPSPGWRKAALGSVV